MENNSTKQISLQQTKEEPFVGIYLGSISKENILFHQFRILGGHSCEMEGHEGFNEQLANMVKVGSVCKISYRGEYITCDGILKHLADVCLL